MSKRAQARRLGYAEATAVRDALLALKGDDEALPIEGWKPLTRRVEKLMNVEAESISESSLRTIVEDFEIPIVFQRAAPKRVSREEIDGVVAKLHELEGLVRVALKQNAVLSTNLTEATHRLDAIETTLSEAVDRINRIDDAVVE